MCYYLPHCGSCEEDALQAFFSPWQCHSIGEKCYHRRSYCYGTQEICGHWPLWFCVLSWCAVPSWEQLTSAWSPCKDYDVDRHGHGLRLVHFVTPYRPRYLLPTPASCTACLDLWFRSLLCHTNYWANIALHCVVHVGCGCGEHSLSLSVCQPSWGRQLMLVLFDTYRDIAIAWVACECWLDI